MAEWTENFDDFEMRRPRDPRGRRQGAAARGDRRADQGLGRADPRAVRGQFSGTSATARSARAAPSSPGAKPSKPPGCRSRRCRSENVEIVRRFNEAGQRSIDAYWENPRSRPAALEAGDLDPETEAALAFLHPEVEYNAVPAALEGGTAPGPPWLVESLGCVSGRERGLQLHDPRTREPRR